MLDRVADDELFAVQSSRIDLNKLQAQSSIQTCIILKTIMFSTVCFLFTMTIITNVTQRKLFAARIPDFRTRFILQKDHLALSKHHPTSLVMNVLAT